MVNTRFPLIFKLTDGSDSLNFSTNELCGLFFFLLNVVEQLLSHFAENPDSKVTVGLGNPAWEFLIKSPDKPYLETNTDF